MRAWLTKQEGFAKSSAMKHTPLVCAALKRGANATGKYAPWLQEALSADCNTT